MLTKPLRNAASMIILARDASKSSRFDYKILTFTRSEKTSIFDNTLCFPGGQLHDSDESPSWTSFFKHHKVPTEQLKRRNEVTKPFIYDPQGSNKIERESSLRFAAIRETFEELGIALCSPASDTSKSPFSDYFHSKDCDIPFWQKQVHSSHETLMNFCDKFGVVPNIMGVYEWSVWLSPIFRKILKRFTTAVFITMLDSIPECHPEEHEVHDYLWLTPDEIYDGQQKDKLFLPPHLFYELHRFIDCTSIDEIANFAKQRDGQSLPLIYPIFYILKDSLAMIFPGDDLYPKNINFYEKNYDERKFSDKTYDEIIVGCKNFCRAEMELLHSKRFLCNIDDGLLKPKSEEVIKFR
ncbi:acyl-coenzyme A diphosphatase NUDT19-like [Chironomus tepperi]|uniref:acyl-coenzyme A diphosphatase NUDT19-like n=1 Tax=Chironomus tepperi TaxID=113505 RepID=UPI00391EEB51